MAKEASEYGLVRLGDEDRALLKSAVSAITKATAALAGKKATGAADDDADAGDGDGDAGDGDAGDGDGDFEDGAGDGDTGDGDGEGEAAPTRDDVQAALRDFANAPGGSKAKAIALLKEKGGVDGLSKLKESKFVAFIAAAKAATKKLKAAAKK